MAKTGKQYVNPYLFTGDPNHMGLGDYLHALGDEGGYQMCRNGSIPAAVMKNIGNGHPIAAVHAERIANWLSNAYQRDIRVGDIANLHIINPGRQLPAPSEET
jgi:hypothetical protein